LIFGNRYQVVGRLGSGGMAEVYEAFDRVLGRTVAVKVLHPTYSRDPNFVARFRREAQAAANLTHPNIVAVYDWGQLRDTYYIVMEKVEGESLKDLINRQGALPLSLAIDIAKQVASALSFAHKRGVIHRDIKPHNILLTEDGTAKVADFGIAQADSTSLTQEGMVVGTAQYISPEQAEGLPATEASDVYSLGVVMFEMLTGTSPFQGETPVAVALKHLQEPVPSPRALNPEVPEEVEAIIFRCLAKNPLDRYQSALELKADLERIEKGLPVEISPLSDEKTMVLPTPRLEKRRLSLWAVVGITIFALLMLTAGAFALWQQMLIASRVVVPNVEQETLSEARKILREKGLKLKVVEEKFSDLYPKDTVISQDPEPGRIVKKGTVVKVVVSLGIELVEVPDVVGMEAIEAASLLGEKGLVAESEEGYSDKVAEGLVISQDPAAGEKVPRGSKITLLVSKGAETLIVPDVVGFLANEATRTLVKEGFKYSLKYQPSDVVAKGRVIKQSPPAGSEGKRGTVVTIYVSTGKAKVAVPNVIGLDESAATDALESAGFVVQAFDTPTTDPTKIGLVINQTPAGGTMANRGSVVKIYVGVISSESTEAP